MPIAQITPERLVRNSAGRIAVASILLCAILSGCQERPNDTAITDVAVIDAAGQRADAAHNSRNALDWQGTYTGTTPCADCEGIRTTLKLEQDGRFTRERIYLGESAVPMLDNGLFSWDREGASITLEGETGGSQQYQVGENRLFHLDRSGNRIDGDLAQYYILEKAMRDPRIEDQRWVLAEVMGQAVEASDERREAFIIFESTQGRLSGNSSCNNFFGEYVLLAGNRIRFGRDMGSTMMACADMTIEDRMLDAIGQVDNYAIAGDKLQLNRAKMAPLLVFRLSAETER